MGKTIKDILKKPTLLFMTLGYRGLFNWMSDERYIRIAYEISTGKKLNLDNPRSFNEKLQWLKLHDRRPEYTTMVDKYEVKKYVVDNIGEEYIIPTLGVWHHFDDIDFNLLPDQFVLKCSHDSGSFVICKDKNILDKKRAKRKLEKCLSHNFFWAGREWPYRNVKPRIIAEEYIENNEQEGPYDYKVWCFNGKARFIQYISGRLGERTYEAFYDTNWVKQDFRYLNPILEMDVPEPVNLKLLVSLAEKLAENLIFARIDFYILPDDSIRFGEITFFPNCGRVEWHPYETDVILGEMIRLPI